MEGDGEKVPVEGGSLVIDARHPACTKGEVFEYRVVVTAAQGKAALHLAGDIALERVPAVSIVQVKPDRVRSAVRKVVT